MQRIETSAKYLDQIVSDMLDMTCIDSGQMILKNEPQSITAVFHDISTMTDGTHDDKRLTIRHSIPILAITANASEEDVRKCLDSSMNVHISKPVNITKLLTHLAALCGGK